MYLKFREQGAYLHVLTVTYISSCVFYIKIEVHWRKLHFSSGKDQKLVLKATT